MPSAASRPSADGTQRGTITIVYLPELQTVHEFTYDAPIGTLFPNQLGTRVAFLDANGSGQLLSPVDDSCVAVPKLPHQCKGFLWDRSDWGVLLAHGQTVRTTPQRSNPRLAEARRCCYRP